MRELYEVCGEMKSGMKFRQYCETSSYAGCVDAEDRLLASAEQHLAKASFTSEGKSNGGPRQIAQRDTKWSTNQTVLIAISSTLTLNILQALLIAWWYGVLI